MQDMLPGQIIVPHTTADPQQPQSSPGAPPAPIRDPSEQPGEGSGPAPAPAPSPVPAAPVQAAAPAPSAAAPEPETQPEPDWYSRQPVGATDAADSQELLPDTIGWTASEFLAHEKGFRWYSAVVAGGVLASVADYLLTRDIFSAAVILFAAIAFGAISARKPRTQQYSLTHHGLQIGAKIYYFQDFKNFSITEEGAIVSIVFMPLKRFMPALTIYVAPDMEDQVIDFLSELLPFEQHKADAVDSLLRRIRF